jgi:hypothetical protein
MQTNTTITLWIVHIILLLLASTNLSIISWAWGNPFTWNYFQFSYRDGWGYRYESNYSLLQVLLYLGTYTSGILVLSLLKYPRAYLSGLAAIVCLLGLVSFALELTHWLWDHHLSWIASFPGVLAMLWLCIGVQLAIVRRGAEHSDAVAR